MNEFMFYENKEQADREELWVKLYRVVTAMRNAMHDMRDRDDYSFDDVLEYVAQIRNLDVLIRQFDAHPLPEEGEIDE